MVESSDEPSLLDRLRSSTSRAYASHNPFGAGDQRPTLPLTNTITRSDAGLPAEPSTSRSSSNDIPSEGTTGDFVADDTTSSLPPPAPPPLDAGDGEAPSSIEPEEKQTIAIRFYETCKEILFSSWLNVLLVFVPVGIAVQAAGVNKTIVFAMNALAIVPLAGLLSHATESVASEMGDTIGALMNITFGNAVELIIFMYVQPDKKRTRRSHGLLSKHPQLGYASRYCPPSFPNIIKRYLFHMLTYLMFVLTALLSPRIQIVQASLLGSILANLLLILGMCFLFGGLRFREQIYNSTVTQMSACLLSLSVMSLLLPVGLPMLFCTKYFLSVKVAMELNLSNRMTDNALDLQTAFHASFTDKAVADKAVLQISRGTSIILLLVYVLYLLFQLMSHSYMYQSTPQHVIDEESHPGVLADMLNSSTSLDTSSSSSDTDSDGSSGSNTTAKRIKRVLRGRRRRKSSASSKDIPSVPSTLRTPSASTFARTAGNGYPAPAEPRNDHGPLVSPPLGAIASGDEADTDGEHDTSYSSRRAPAVNFRDFENEKVDSGSKSPEIKRKRKSKKKSRKTAILDEKEPEVSEKPASLKQLNSNTGGRPVTPHVGFMQDVQCAPESSPRRPFNMRGLTVRDVVPAMPAMPKVLSSTVFSTANPTGPSTRGVLATGITPRALHRSSSLPGRLNQVQAGRQPSNPPVQPQPLHLPAEVNGSLSSKDDNPLKKRMSRITAIFLLLASTGLVAVCAEFLVGSIGYLVSNTGVSEAFVGLIILPIVGNAAEHVTAVTVASKNKMDLAIGVAVGSSIQIALFVTPVIVLLGWVLDKDMSLYFSLFETISLFVSAFIVNFLVLDGRSNYLEGALLIAAYVIIALAAFFFPDSNEQSTFGGGHSIQRMLRMR